MSLLSTFATKNKRLIAMVDPKAVRQTSEAVQSCKVLDIDNHSTSETQYKVEVKNGGKVDIFWVPQHSVRAVLEVTKTDD